MAIRLSGGFETSEFWHEVREHLEKHLSDARQQDWQVGLQPITAAAREQADVNDDAGWAMHGSEQRKVFDAFAPMDTAETDDAEHVARLIWDALDQIAIGED